MQRPDHSLRYLQFLGLPLSHYELTFVIFFLLFSHCCVNMPISFLSFPSQTKSIQTILSFCFCLKIFPQISHLIEKIGQKGHIFSDSCSLGSRYLPARVGESMLGGRGDTCAFFYKIQKFHNHRLLF